MRTEVLSMKVVFPAVIGCMFTTAAFLNADDRKDGLNEFQGSWVQASKELNGEKKDVKKTVVNFKADMFETVEDGKSIESGTIQVDSSKNPKTYSVTISGEFAEKGKTYNGIYKIDGGTMTTCVNTNAGKEAPSEFTSKPGTGHQLIVWKRDKP
jgi:uncharacterized protein (TIGR03067 family)